MPVHELNEPIKVVMPLVEHEDIREDLIFNDQNDISLFKNAIYGVQIGDYPYLKNFADEVIPAINAIIAEKIKLLFEKF